MAQGFLTYYGKRFHKKARLSEEVEHILRGYAWPGNVRELENLIQGLLVTCKGGYIQAADLAGIRPEAPAPDSAPAPFRLPDIEGRSLKSIMKEVEGQVLEAGLRRYGSIGELARHFEMDRSTIFRKVRGLGGARPARRARKKRERSAEDERP